MLFTLAENILQVDFFVWKNKCRVVKRVDFTVIAAEYWFLIPAGKKMDYLGDKLTVAQTHMTQWMGTVRRSLQEALNLVTTAVAHERSGGDGGSRTPFKRTSSFRHLASRSRESFRRFSVRSQQRFSSLRKRQTSSEPPELVSYAPFWASRGR